MLFVYLLRKGTGLAERKSLTKHKRLQAVRVHSIQHLPPSELFFLRGLGFTPNIFMFPKISLLGDEDEDESTEGSGCLPSLNVGVPTSAERERECVCVCMTMCETDGRGDIDR